MFYHSPMYFHSSLAILPTSVLVISGQHSEFKNRFHFSFVCVLINCLFYISSLSEIISICISLQMISFPCSSILIAFKVPLSSLQTLSGVSLWIQTTSAPLTYSWGLGLFANLILLWNYPGHSSVFVFWDYHVLCSLVKLLPQWHSYDRPILLSTES